MKKIKFSAKMIAFAMFVLPFAFLLTACGGGDLNKFSGIIFANKNFDYDGQEHEIIVSGNLPQGANVVYQNNKATNAGQYNAIVEISMEGYETLRLTAILTINKANYDMSSASWNYTTPFVYDGQEKQVVVDGLPQGVTVKQYQNNKKTAVGTYTASVELDYDTVNYNKPTLADLSWVITNSQTQLKEFENIKFKNESFEYDGTEKMIEVSGFLPEGTTVTYSCNENPNIQNKATETGTYTIKAYITNPEYKPLELTAVMKIKGEDKNRHIFADDNGNIYFANALDNDYLYKYDGTTITRVSYDLPYNFVKFGDEIVFSSNSLFNKNIKSISSSTVSALYATKADYLATDGTYLYYSVNGLTQAKSGVFKLDLSGDEPVEIKLFEGKSKYLNYYNGCLYYADGTNGYKLTKYSLSQKTITLIRDEKISMLAAENGYLFYNVENLVGDYIENYNLSTNVYTKLTMDAGTNLTLIGNRLYYINVDLFKSAVFGDGIYYVNAYPSSNANFAGTKLFDGDNNYSSLTKLNNNEIAYYNVDNQLMYIYNISNGTSENVLENFEKPENVKLSTGSKTKAYNGKVYYLDLNKDKTLNCYNPETAQTTKVTSNTVSDFTIVGDYLYYNSISCFVNNDLYRINLKTGGVPELMSKYDCVDVAISNDKIFYVERNASGVRTAIRQVASNGEDVMLYSKGVNNLRCYNGYLYFEDGGALYRMPTQGWTKDVSEKIKDKNVDIFEIYNGVVYYREKFTFNKQLSKINVDGTGYDVLYENCDPVDIIIENGVIYFYSDTVSSSTAGIFKINIDGTGATRISAKTVSGATYYMSNICLVGNFIYFVNYALGGIGGDSCLYKLNISTSAITKVA